MTHTSDAVQGQGANKADHSDDDEYYYIVSQAADRALEKWHAKKQAELIEIEINTPESRAFYSAVGGLKPTDVPWACEYMSYFKQESRFIQNVVDALESRTTT